MTEEDIINFYNYTPTTLNQYPIDRVLNEFKNEIDVYIKDKNLLYEDGILKIKSDHRITDFDFVLLDGGPFSGDAEFEDIYGAKFIALDDVNDIKNNSNYYRLVNDVKYKLTHEDWNLRNGFAIFKKNTT